MTVKTATATLGGKNLLASSPVEWTESDGTSPVVKTFDMVPEDALSLLESAAPVTLKTDDLTVEFLYIINAEPGPNANILRITVADRRIWWSYKIVLRRYNIRRHVGPRRLVNPQTIEISPLVDTVQYWPWSLKDGETRWKADEAAIDVIDTVLMHEEEHKHVAKAKLQIDPPMLKSLKNFPVEDWVYDDRGDMVIGRLLATLPEAGISVRPDGTVRVRSKADGTEEETLNLLGSEVDQEGHIEYVSKHLLRPFEIHVKFTRECEVRFDFAELASRSSTTADVPDKREIENVLPITDYELKVGGDTMCQGTWITVDAALNAWAADGSAPGLGAALDHEHIQRSMVPYMDLWSALGLHGAIEGSLRDWALRIRAIQEHYRRTYRINRRWMDRILSLHAYRAATVDPVTGTRAPAMAYLDFAYLGSVRARLRQIGEAGSSAYATNVEIYDDGDDITSDTPATPAEVRIVDEDQGIIQINFLPDPYRLYEMMIPSKIELSNDSTPANAQGGPGIPGPTPTGMLRGNTFPIGFGMLNEVNPENYPRLTASHALAIIMTAIPAAPNNTNQLHTIVIQPQDVTGMLPTGAARGLLASHGPPMEVRVKYETARMAWLDSASDRIEQMFGVDADIADAGEVNVDDLVVNQSDDDEAGDLTVIAKAVAAQVYGSLADHYQGRMAGNVQPNARLNGWISEITHELGTEGKRFTRLMMPDKVEGLNVYSLMDSGTRAILMRLALPPGAKK